MAKRFYTNVDVQQNQDGFHVLLDGRVLKTPGKKPLLISTPSRAQFVADEWDAQTDEIDPQTMPCTRLMNVACEITPTRRPDLWDEFSNYSQSDLLCFRADHPQDLRARQDQKWQSVLDWAQEQHGISLVVTTGLSAVQHPKSSVVKTAEIAKAMSDENLTLLLHYTGSFGSAILGLAVMEKYMDAKTAYDLSVLDEIFQNESNGVDDEAVARNAAICQELEVLERLI